MPPDAPPVAEPTSEEELARVLADAARHGWRVVPRGGGTKADWGNPPERIDLLLSTLGLNRVLEHAAGDMTVTVEAGCTIAALQDTLARHHQRLALDPLWPSVATVGGVVATNDSGPLRIAFGSVRDLVLGITVALPDGTLASSGGKVVKNVAGYDLPKLMTGAFGTLGVITRATFRLHPFPGEARTFEFAAPSPAAATRFVLAMHDSPLSVTGLQVFAVHDAPPAVAVRVEGSPDGVNASAAPLARLAGACGFAPSEASRPWSRGEWIWGTRDPVAKLTFLPARLADVCASMPPAPWALVAQSVGVALLSTPAPPKEIEQTATRIGSLGGSFTLLRGDDELKRRLDPLQNNDALPLMRRIKHRFDPTGVLNPGRLGGGI